MLTAIHEQSGAEYRPAIVEQAEMVAASARQVLTAQRDVESLDERIAAMAPLAEGEGK